MPNHIHGILQILPTNVGTRHGVSDYNASDSSDYNTSDKNMSDKNMSVGTRHGVSLQTHTEMHRTDQQTDMPWHVPTVQYNQFSKPIHGSISTIIGQYKSSVTRWCNKNNHSYFGWQSKFHDHVIRNRNDYNRITNYIDTNIQNWSDDCFF